MFTQPNGRPIDLTMDRTEWKRLLADAGVRDARLHDARHTATTVLLLLSVPEPAVMEFMEAYSGPRKTISAHGVSQ
jgi:integrase